MDEWLTNLKVGDTVIVQSWGMSNRIYCSTVQRLTKTLIFALTGGKFRRMDGHSSPGPWDTGILLEPTPENLELVKQENLRVRRMRVCDTTPGWLRNDL